MNINQHISESIFHGSPKEKNGIQHYLMSGHCPSNASNISSYVTYLRAKRQIAIWSKNLKFTYIKKDAVGLICTIYICARYVESICARKHVLTKKYISAFRNATSNMYYYNVKRFDLISFCMKMWLYIFCNNLSLKQINQGLLITWLEMRT